MKALLDYLHKWKLSDPQSLTVTTTSCLFTVMWNERPAVLKLLTPAGMLHELKSALALRCFNGNATVRLLLCDDQALLLEYAEGEDLKALVKRGEDVRATRIIANLLNALHSAHVGAAPPEFMTLDRQFRSLFVRAKQDKAEGISSLFIRAAETAEKLLATETDLCVLHGDMHHENVRYSAKRGWLAFDPKGIYGERAYDAANTLCNPSGMDGLVANEDRLMRTAGIMAQALNLDIRRLLAFTFVHACLSACWTMEDCENPSPSLPVLKIAEIIESLD